MTLTDTQRAQIDRYVQDALEYNLKVNITSDDSTPLLRDRHIADGLAVVPTLRELFSGGTPSILDLGSGGGFIGMAIKIAWPEARVTLMEPLERKFRFLSAAAARLGLADLRVLRKSASEARAAGLEHDLVVERALAELPQAVEWAIPLTRAFGYFIAYQSAPADGDFLKKSLAKAGARLVKSVPYQLPADDRRRYFAVFQREAKGEN